jgi:putative hydrolase of the HAD superfamily
MTTAIYFDLDGTLLQYTEPYPALVTAAFEDVVGRAEDDWGEAYTEAFLERFERLDEDPYERAMADICGEFGVDADAEALADALAAQEQAGTTVSEDATASLTQLAKSDRLGVLTDGVPEWQQAKLAHHDLERYFETVVTSYEAGAHKPAAAPFELARERIAADEYVLVGDDYEADVEGARQNGFVPIHFERSGTGFWGTLKAML